MRNSHFPSPNFRSLPVASHIAGSTTKKFQKIRRIKHEDKEAIEKLRVGDRRTDRDEFFGLTMEVKVVPRPDFVKHASFL